MTGPIIVEDVVYEKADRDASGLLESENLIFRRLTFKRTEGLVQSEALLTRDGLSENIVGQTERKKSGSSSKSKKRGNQRQIDGIDFCLQYSIFFFGEL